RLPSTADVVEREALRREVVDAVLGLDEPYRTTLLLRFFEDEPASSIAKRLGIPVETVRTRIKRGLDRVRERLDAEHDGDRRAWLVALVPLAKPAPAASLVLTGAIVMKLAMKLLVAVTIVLAILFAWRAFTPTLDVATARVTPTASKNTTVAERNDAAVMPNAVTAAATSTPARHATGLVVDRGRTPIVGARIVSIPSAIAAVVAIDSGGSTATRATTSDASGRFDIDLCEGSADYDLVVEAHGFAPTVREAVKSRDDVMIALDRAFALVGTVMDREGQPIVGATIRWTGRLGAGCSTREAISNAKGAYRLDDLPPSQPGLSLGSSNSFIEVRADHYAPLVLLTTEWLRASSPRGEVVINPVMIRGATMRGRIEDAESGEPLAGVRVVAWIDVVLTWGRGRQGSVQGSERCCIFGETVSKDDGTYCLEHLPAAGMYAFAEGTPQSTPIGSVAALARGRAPKVVELYEAPDGSTMEASFQVWPSGTVRGRVVDVQGNPIAASMVWRDWEDHAIGWLTDALGGGEWNARTDAAGRYTIGVAADHRANGASLVVRAFDDYHGLLKPDPACSVHVSVRAGQTVEAPDIVIAHDGPSVDVFVEEADGRGIGGALVEFHQIDDRTSEQADEKGAVHFQFDKEAKLDDHPLLVVSAAKHAPAMSPELELSMGEPSSVHVTLGPPHSLSGKVVYSDGSPAAGAIVRVGNGSLPVADVFRLDGESLTVSRSGDLAGYGRAVTAEDGSFDVRDLPAGPYHVGACVDPWEAAAAAIRSSVPSDLSDLVVTLTGSPPKDLSTIEGTVTDGKTDGPILSFTVWLQSGDRRVDGAPTAPGRFRVERVPPGKWTLWVRAAGYPLRADRVDVGSVKASKPLTIVMNRGFTVHGVVRARADIDLRNATVIFRSIGWSGEPNDREPHALVLADGEYSVSGLTHGTYQPVVVTASETHLPMQLAADPPVAIDAPIEGGDASLDFAVIPASFLTVTVRSPRLPSPRSSTRTTREQAELRAAYRIEIEDVTGRLVQKCGLDFDGRVVSWLAPATYVVRVSIPDAPPQEKTVHLDGDSSSVEFDVP
ncbi:MAG: hypothetical protein HY292_21275, partial [Planctomycetes bacterium]|nr:hypothetical protein [Planctomycetota bacterium]